MPLETRSVAEGLPKLHRKALETLVGRSPCPVATFRAIAAGVASVDLRCADAEPVRRRFNAYYGVRRNAAWRTAFYEQFEAAKQDQGTGVDLFAAIIRKLETQTGRVEASFVSKLVATLNPEYPIIDSVVRAWVAPLTEAPPFKGGIEGANAYYRWLTNLMGELVLSREAQAWTTVFDATFPAPPGEAAIPALKKLDFLIWAGADR
jgi:hypothetical protein